MAVKQTAGRDQLGDFAPKFAELNDDVLFGEVWSREDKLSLRDRSLVTVTALMAQGLIDDSFRYHLMTAKANGITKEEIAEIVTHAAFYCGWPKAWAVLKRQRKFGAIDKAAMRHKLFAHGTVFRKSVALNHIAFDFHLLKRKHKQRHTKQISCAFFYTLLYII